MSSKVIEASESKGDKIGEKKFVYKYLRKGTCAYPIFTTNDTTKYQKLNTINMK